MLRCIERRLSQTIPAFFGTTFLIFAVVCLMPGDPATVFGDDRSLSEATAAQIRAQYNLDKPSRMQYLLYLKGVFTLGFGTMLNGQKVTSIMATAFPMTVRLAIYALATGTSLGIDLDVVTGMRCGKRFDSIILVVSLLLVSVPTLVLDFVLQYVPGIQLVTLPITASASIGIKNLAMPVVVLGGVSLTYAVRLTRQSVSEDASADYVRTACVKGLSGGVAITRHILHSSLIPVATFIGGNLSALMGSAVITEGIFNIYDVDGTLWSAIIKDEPQTVVSVTTMLVLVYIIANPIVGLLYAVFDLRIRYE